MSKEWRGIGMKLYHGSNIAIEKIDLSQGRPAKDFGRGFYLSGDSEQWLDFILKNRANRSLEQTHDYDLVFGPIANDAVAVSIALYTDKFISKEELLRRLKYRHETFQYFFATEKAISKLTVSHE